MPTSKPPPAAVTRAFGVAEPPRPLPGGQGTSWVAGNLVFKPDAGDLHEWLATALAGVVTAGFRLALPVATEQGSWNHQGWSATHWIEGTEPNYANASTWPADLAAGQAFHRAVADLPRPHLLDARQDWWAQADRAAWDEQPIGYHREFAPIARRLQAAFRPLGPSQLVHADLTHNVLFARDQTPAIIDISPYWRPPAYAEAVVVADAMCWHRAQASLLDDVGISVTAVARALLFRMATTNQRAATGTDIPDLHTEAHRYALATTAIGL